MNHLKSLSNKRLYLIVACSELGVCLIGQFFLSHPFSFLNLANAAGMVGLLSLLLGAVIFIVQGGFFDSIVYSFKRVSRTLRKRKLGAADAEAPLAELRRHDGSERWSITWPFLIIGATLFIISLILSAYV
ncbi:MAG: DUF3899 domain-containing protein [Sporolactobacillus sp.]